MPSSACDWSSDVCSSDRSEEHTSELQSRSDLVCRLLLEKKKKNTRSEREHRDTFMRLLNRHIKNSEPYSTTNDLQLTGHLQRLQTCSSVEHLPAHGHGS